MTTVAIVRKAGRPPAPKQLHLQAPHIGLLVAVAQFGLATAGQLARYFLDHKDFEGVNVETIISQLYTYHYLDHCNPQFRFSPSIHGSDALAYGVSDRGYDLLDGAGLLYGTRTHWKENLTQLKYESYKHTIGVTERIVGAHELAQRRDGFELVSQATIVERSQTTFTDDVRPVRWRVPARWDGKLMDPVPYLQPDYVFNVVRDQRDTFLFLEEDRGRMPINRTNPHQSSVRRKLTLYSATYAQGLLKPIGIPSFQVLFLTPTNRRLWNIVAYTKAHVNEIPNPNMFLVGSQEDYAKYGNILELPWRNTLGEEVGLL